MNKEEMKMFIEAINLLEEKKEIAESIIIAFSNVKEAPIYKQYTKEKEIYEYLIEILYEKGGSKDERSNR